MQRRPEAYHRKVLAGPSAATANVASIHDRVVFKQEGLDQRLQYDRFPRKSLDGPLLRRTRPRWRRSPRREPRTWRLCRPAIRSQAARGADRVQVQMRRDGNAWGIPLAITKAVTMVAGSEQLEIAYLIENLPAGRTAALRHRVQLCWAARRCRRSFLQRSRGKSPGTARATARSAARPRTWR